MIPHDTFTPHGYLDNPYHSWKLNPSGVVRSLAPLGMGWHVPNVGSYVRNQFQYTAHLSLGLKIGSDVFIAPEDFSRHGCTVVSDLHTKNRFEYVCTIPRYELTLRARYFLISEHTLGCIVKLSTTLEQPLPVTCYLLHLHTHNPFTSRLWEHGLYALQDRAHARAVLGIASEGDAFVHGARSADGGDLICREMGYMVSLQEASLWAQGESVPRPHTIQRQEETGWQIRTLVLPYDLTLTGQEERVINGVLARGVSSDEAVRRWEEGCEEIVRAEVDHRSDDELFWSHTPQLSGNWPDAWRRGWVYDWETLRMVIRPSAGVIGHAWDGMQIQAPRLVLAEAAMDTLFLSYADPVLASEVILGHFASAPHPQIPCMREDGSYNMMADDGEICGTAPEWGFPVRCCDQIFRRTGDRRWLSRLYPHVAAYLRWWLEQRRDDEGWLVYNCSWESGQDLSSRFGPQQTGGTIIQQVRAVDLQASMVQGAEILVHWASLLAEDTSATSDTDFSAEMLYWRRIANEFTVKTRRMWQDGWFRDYDSVAQEWSAIQDTMHLAPIFCGASGWGHVEQLRSALAQPPLHSGWAPLSWPPVVMTVVGAAEAAEMPQEAAELAYRFIDASYRSTDQVTMGEDGGLPGVTREYLRSTETQDANSPDYASAGIEGYGWGTLSIYLLLRYLMGLYEVDAETIRIAPMLPSLLRRAGSRYRVDALQWGQYTLTIECVVLDDQRYSWSMSCTLSTADRSSIVATAIDGEAPAMAPFEQSWEGLWGEVRTLSLPHLINISSVNQMKPDGST